jgi:hypothetical protein
VKYRLFLKLILTSLLGTIFVSCSLNNDSKIVKLPEMVNADNGLREIRMRRYGCLFLGGEQDPLDCTQNEELSSETRQSAPGITDDIAENLRINELTPWLNTRARTVVNPTVMYDSSKEEMYVNLFLRLFDETSNRFTDLKLTKTSIDERVKENI